MTGFVRSIILAACLVLASAASSCGHGAPAPSTMHGLDLPGDLAGCYALFDRRGRPASDSLYFAPSHVRLDSTAVPTDREWDGPRPLWTLAKLDANLRPLRDQRPTAALYWTADSISGNVRMNFHTGFSGSELIFSSRRAGDTLRGHAMQHWDFGPPFTTKGGPVTAVRVPCPDSVPGEGSIP